MALSVGAAAWVIKLDISCKLFPVLVYIIHLSLVFSDHSINFKQVSDIQDTAPDNTALDLTTTKLIFQPSLLFLSPDTFKKYLKHGLCNKIVTFDQTKPRPNAGLIRTLFFDSRNESQANLFTYLNIE